MSRIGFEGALLVAVVAVHVQDLNEATSFSPKCSSLILDPCILSFILHHFILSCHNILRGLSIGTSNVNAMLDADVPQSYSGTAVVASAAI